MFRNGGVLKQTEKWFYMREVVDVVSFINIWEFILHQNSSGQRPRTFWLFKQVKLFSKSFNISINLVNFAQKIFSNYSTQLLNLFSVMAPKFGATNTAKKLKNYISSFVKDMLVFIKILLIILF